MFQNSFSLPVIHESTDGFSHFFKENLIYRWGTAHDVPRSKVGQKFIRLQMSDLLIIPAWDRRTQARM